MTNRKRVNVFGAGFTSALSSIIAILVGLAVGFILLLATNPAQAARGIGIIASGGFNGGMKGIGQTLYYATPLILTGLSVGFCFKTGLFNIGAPGQLIVGAFAGIWVGANATWIPSPLLWLAALLAAALAGALWGAIPGLFKAMLNVHEVIACIMCNYIGMYAVNYLIKNSNVYDALKNQTIDMTRAAIPKAGLDKIFYSLKGRFMDSSSVNAGIHIALALAVVMYIILNKTVLGYELKACSLNRYASKYAGIQEKRSILLSLTIAGSLSGIAGGLMYLAPAGGLHINVVETLSAQGFNGIPVALLGLSNPIGIIFSALFVAHIDQGGYYLQRLEYMPQIIDIIIAVIIYFSAFALLMRQAIGAIQSRLSSRSGKRLIEGAADAQEASKHD